MPCKFSNIPPNIAGIFARCLSPHGCALSVLTTASTFSCLSASSEVGVPWNQKNNSRGSLRFIGMKKLF